MLLYNLEFQQMHRMNDMVSEFGKTKIEKDKELREVDDKLKDLQAGFSQTEKQRIVTEISSVANDLQRKMDQKWDQQATVIQF